MTKIAAAYTRTSQEQDDAFSLSSQLDGITDYADEYEIKVPEEYIFREEFTGKVASRPEYNKIRQLIRERRIDCVIVYDASRFARAMEISIHMLDELFEAGVELHLVSWAAQVRNINADRDHFYDESLYADKERRKIIERLARGKRKKIKDGIWVGSSVNKYGFGKRGNRKTTEMYIIEEEAKVINLIFSLFVQERKTVRQIIQTLEAAGYPTPSQAKGFWQQSTHWSDGPIYRILRDEVYIGVWYVNRDKRVKSPVTAGKLTNITRPKEEWTRLEFPHLQIISDDLFDQAQKILDQGKAHYCRRIINEYLMVGRLTCTCNYNIKASTTVRPDKRYSYYMRSDFCTTCSLPHIRVEKVDGYVFEWVQDLLRNPEAILTGYQRMKAVQEHDNQDLLARVSEAEATIDRYTRELKRYAEMYAQNLITLDIMREKKTELDKRIATSQAVLAEYAEVAKQTVLTDEEIKKRVSDLRMIKAEVDKLETVEFKHKKRLVELLNVQGIIGLEDGRPYLDILWCGEVQTRRFLWEDSASRWQSTGQSQSP